MSCVYLVVPVTYGSSLPTGCESASSRDEVMCAFLSLSLGTSRAVAARPSRARASLARSRRSRRRPAVAGRPGSPRCATQREICCGCCVETTHAPLQHKLRWRFYARGTL